MRMRSLALTILLFALSVCTQTTCAQTTHVYPTTDSNNTWTGANSFNGTIAISGNVADLHLTGTPTSTTPPVNDNSTKVMTTAWFWNQSAVTTNSSPLFSGTVAESTAPALNDNSANMPTTAWFWSNFANTVKTNQNNTYTAGDTQIFENDGTHAGIRIAPFPSVATPSTLLTGDIWTTGLTLPQRLGFYDGIGVQFLAQLSDLTAKAPLASPTFTGTPAAPTPSTADNSTTIATTAYVQSNLSSYATLASPTLTGTPAAPTPSVGDSSTKIATTAFVAANAPTLPTDIDLTAQTAAIGATNIIASAAAAQYRVSWNARITTAAGTSSTLGPLMITYTDPTSAVVSVRVQAQYDYSGGFGIEISDSTNTTPVAMYGIPILINCKSGTAIQYAFGYASNAAAAMNYTLHIRLEKVQ